MWPSHTERLPMLVILTHNIKYSWKPSTKIFPNPKKSCVQKYLNFGLFMITLTVHNNIALQDQHLVVPKTSGKCTLSGFQIWFESVPLTCSRTCQSYSMRVFSDSCQSFVRLSSTNDNVHNNLLLNNSNTFIFHFMFSICLNTICFPQRLKNQ